MKHCALARGPGGKLGHVCSLHLHLDHLFALRPWATYLTFLGVLCVMEINSPISKGISVALSPPSPVTLGSAQDQAVPGGRHGGNHNIDPARRKWGGQAAGVPGLGETAR